MGKFAELPASQRIPGAVRATAAGAFLTRINESGRAAVQERRVTVW
jgi:hypothetical protein